MAGGGRPSCFISIQQVSQNVCDHWSLVFFCEKSEHILEELKVILYFHLLLKLVFVIISGGIRLLLGLFNYVLSGGFLVAWSVFQISCEIFYLEKLYLFALFRSVFLNGQFLNCVNSALFQIPAVKSFCEVSPRASLKFPFAKNFRHIES